MKATRPAGRGPACVLCDCAPPSVPLGRKAVSPRGRGVSELWPIGASPSGTTARDGRMREAEAFTILAHYVARVEGSFYEKLRNNAEL